MPTRASEVIPPCTLFIAGYIENIDAMAVAKACHALGCGRTKPGQPVKLPPGVILDRKPGDLVQEGDSILQVHHDEEISEPVLRSVLETLLDGITLVSQPPTAQSLVIDKVV